MIKTTVKAATVAAAVFGSALFTDTIHAEQSQESIQNERSEVKEDLSKAESKIADVLIDIKELNQAIEKNNETLEANESALKEIDEEIAEKENKVEKIETEINELEDKIEKRFDILKNRAISLQKNGGDIGYLEVIFGSKSFSDFINRISAISKISDSDQELIEKQKDDKAKVEKKKEEIEDKLDELNDRQAELEVVQERIKEQKEENKEAKKNLKNKEKELNTKKKDLKIKDSKLATLEEKVEESYTSSTDNSGNLNHLSDKEESSSQSSGVLGWPTSGGYVSSQMGQRWNRQHKGIDIARTDRSTVPPIFAADDGAVKSASFNNGGYGNRIVIEHGNGIKTVYAHLSSMSVSSGDKVSKGQKIGVMGDTGHSTGIHLHFEVYKNGALQNPLNYVSQ